MKTPIYLTQELYEKLAKEKERSKLVQKLLSEYYQDRTKRERKDEAKT